MLLRVYPPTSHNLAKLFRLAMATGRSKLPMAEVLQDVGQDEEEELCIEESGYVDEQGLNIQQRLELQSVEAAVARTPQPDRNGIVHGWAQLDFSKMTEDQQVVLLHASLVMKAWETMENLGVRDAT